MRPFQSESLSHDPIHGYIPFLSRAGLPSGEASEQELLDHPWIQRLRQIHQLQTAWWVFPSAEHTRFQHVVGSMHMASRMVGSLYESLAEVCDDVPSRGYVESLARLAALLHDVGHGPFGHFFDEHYLAQYSLTHETLGGQIIREELGDLLGRIRRNPNSRLEPNEKIDPAQVAYLIVRPKNETSDGAPKWLRFMRSLFSGLYTVDNMDFVLRDAYMSGYSTRAFDLDRLIHYSFFSDSGLTIHERGLSALVRFIGVRAELFRTIYFHRTVRAIDLTLQDLFADSRPYLFPGNPAEHLADYQRFTEWSLLIDVAHWYNSAEPGKQELGRRWRTFLGRQVRWKMACERTVYFEPGDAERSSIFSHEEFFARALREILPAELKELPLRVDLPRHVHRPGTRGPADGQNYLYSPASDRLRKLSDSELFRHIPASYRICRIYAQTNEHDAALAAALDELIGPGGGDDATNM
ncbi:MAG: HD domain-containing protein [Pirellulales bacterium]